MIGGLNVGCLNMSFCKLFLADQKSQGKNEFSPNQSGKANCWWVSHSFYFCVNPFFLNTFSPSLFVATAGENKIEPETLLLIFLNAIAFVISTALGAEIGTHATTCGPKKNKLIIIKNIAMITCFQLFIVVVGEMNARKAMTLLFVPEKHFHSCWTSLCESVCFPFGIISSSPISNHAHYEAWEALSEFH